MSSPLSGLPARLPELAPPIGHASWQKERAQRAALCEGAAQDPRLLPACLAAWSLPPAALRAALSELEPPAAPEIDQLCAWVFAEHETPAGDTVRAEVEWDREACRAIDPAHWGASERRADWGASERRVASLYLLSRLGEELALRERRLPAETVWLADSRDQRAASAWRALLRGPPDLAAGAELRALFGGRVRAAFQGVSVVLGLPSDIGRQHGEAALEQLDLVGIGAHLDLATRVLETTGEPLARLEAVLDDDGRERVASCIAGRESWTQVAGMLGRRCDGLGQGADLVVLLRLVATLQRGQARPHSLGLPGWGVVSANRSRMRGRLRAVAGERPAALGEALAALDAPFARTSAAVSRFAWAWAWREARRGFGFDLGRMLPTPCQVPPPRQAPLQPLGEAEERAVLAFLLVVLGRGCWPDLERWLAGDPGRDLSRTFYRCLEQLPDRVADPQPRGQRARAYLRLVGLLEDDGLEELLPRLRALAGRVAALPAGAALRQRFAEALDEPWRGTGLPMPRHHLSTFRERCLAFLAWGTRAPQG